MNLDQIIGFKLYKAFTLIKTQLFHEFYIRKIPINFEQWIIINRLWDKDGIPQRELLLKVNQSKGNFARTLKKMEEEKLIERIKNEEDSRSQLIFLTSKSKKLKNQLRPLVAKTLSYATEGISQKDLDTTMKVLDKIRENFENEGALSCGKN